MAFGRAARGILSLLGAFSLVAILASGPALASGPSSNRILNYQLRLTDASGIPVADGTKNLKLTFYTAPSGGTQLYTFCATTDSPTGTPESFPVSFANGTASVLIGDTSITCNSSGFEQAIPATLFDNAAIYLGVTVNSDSEMTPRKRVVAAGYSLNADKLDDLETSAAGGSNAFVPVTDTSGNFTLTRNVTVDTNTFFVDAGNNRVGIGTAAPAEALEIAGTTPALYINGSTSGLISWSLAGVGAPAFTTRSAGTKIVLFPGITASQVDYALGIDAFTMWYSVPQANSSHFHKFYAGTTELMRIRGDGNVGIGQTSPSAKLELLNTAGGDILEFNNTGAVGGGIWTWSYAGASSGDLNLTSAWDNYRISIDTDSSAADSFEVLRQGGTGFGLFDGEFGVGTASPGYKLHVLGNSAEEQLVRFESSDVNFTAASVSNTTQTSNASFYMTVGGSAGLSVFGLGTQAGIASLEVNSDNQGVIGNRRNAPLKFATNDAVRATFDAAGNFGIGDTTPDSLLDVTSALASDGIFIDNAAATGDPVLSFRLSDVGQFTMGVDDSTTNDDFVFSDGSVLGTNNRFSVSGSTGNITVHSTTATGTVSPTTGQLIFDNQFDNSGNATANKIVLFDDGTTFRAGFGVSTSSLDVFSGGAFRFFVDHLNETTMGTEALSIDATGNVGVGDPTPDALLDVAGTFRTDGALTFGDAAADTVTSNAAAWTFANDTTVALTGGVDGINFDANTLSIDATNNRVGIGTNAPTAPLHVRSGSVPDILIEETVVGSAAQIQYQNTTRTWEMGGDASPDGFYLQPSTGAFGQGTFFLDPNGNLSLGTTTTSTHLSVGSSTSTADEILKITGQNDAAIQLFADTDNVTEDHNAYIHMTQDPGTGREAFLGLVGNAATDPANGGYTGTLANALFVGNSDATPIQFGTNDSVRMTIDGSGNVGIGDTSPASLLTVGDGDRFNVNASGDVTSTFTTLDGSTTTTGSGSNSTSLAVTSGTNFNTGNYVQVASAACVANPCFAKITAGGGTGTLTISPALTWNAADAVTEVHVPEIGGQDTTQALANRYGRGYFIDGVVTGNGSTYFSDNRIESGGTLQINVGSNQPITTGTGTFTVGGTFSLGDAATDALTITSELLNAPGGYALQFEGATNDNIYTKLVITDPTSTTKTITVPDASGTLLLSAGALAANYIVGTDGSGALSTANGIATSASLDALFSDDTGSGAIVFANTPSLVTPDINSGNFSSSMTTTDGTFDMFIGASPGTALNFGPNTASTVLNLVGGYSSNGCSIAGSSGDLTCTGALGLGDSTPDARADIDYSTSASNTSQIGYGLLLTDTGTYTTGTTVKRGINLDLDISGNATGGLLDAFSGIFDTTYTGTASAAAQVYVTGLRSNASFGGIATTTSNVAVAGHDVRVSGNIGTTAVAEHAGMYVSVTGTADNNYGMRITAVTDATNNYSVYSETTALSYFAGNVGIGDSSPAALLTVGTADAFQVDASGNVTVAGNLKVGNGSPSLALDGEDAYVEGTFEADGAARFDNTLNANGVMNLGDGGDTGAINTSDWDISATGVMTGIGAITTDGNFSQTGATTFSTGTNQVSLNGNTVLTGGVNLTLTTGTGRYLQTHTDSGNDAFTVNTSGLTTGKAMVVTSSSNSFSGGNMVSFDRTATGSGTNHNGNLVNINFDVTTVSNAGGHSGKVLNISRNNNNNSGSSHTFSGAVAAISDAAVQTSGGVSHTADVLTLTQSYSLNSGAALDVTTAGNGFVARFNDDGTLTDSTPFVIDDNGAVSIGGTAPGTSLHILENATSGNLGLTIENDGVTTSNLNMFRVISEVGGANNVKASIDSDGDLALDGTITASSGGAAIYAGDFSGGVHVTAGTTSASQLLVEGCPSNGTCVPGQVVAKGTGGATKGGYFVSDTDNAGSESGLIIKQAGTTKWFVYNPVSSNDFRLYSGSTDKLTLTDTGTMTVNATADGAVIQIAQGGTVEGTISVSGTTVSYGAFTGSHYGWTNEIIERGMLVAMTGSNRNYHGDPASEILYGISLTSKENDSAVLGSYLAKLKPDLAADDENPHMVMASGNGDMWIVDEGQNIAVGDNLISSGTPGHARRDPETFDVSHVIARASENVDWSTVSETVNGKKHKKITVLYESFDRHNAGKYFTYTGGSDTGNRSMTLSTLTDAGDYKLSLKNDEADEVAYFGANGDVAIRGRMFLSDRGILQNNRYMYYDGSSGPGGDFIRTNAAGWGTGSYDFAEMFPSGEALEPGDLVMVDTRSSSAMRRAMTGIEDASPHLLAGVVSTRPGFLAGMNDVGNYPIALEGRVPARVSGKVKIGDPITMSATAGVGVAATEPSYVVGTALEAKESEGLGTVTVFVKTGWWNGSTVTVTNNEVSQATVSPQLGFMTSNLDMAGYAITTIGALSGINGIWSIDGNGVFKTRENYVVEHQTDSGLVPTFASQSQKSEVTASGNAQLADGVATVTFDESFRNIISGGTPLKVIVTLTSGDAVGVYVTEKTIQGFTVRELASGTSEATFDWLVIARRKGFDDPTEEVSIVEPPTGPSPASTPAPSPEPAPTPEPVPEPSPEPPSASPEPATAPAPELSPAE